MIARRLIAATLLAGASALAAAAATVAVPYYTPESYADGLLGHALAPRSARFAEAAAALDPALAALCEAADAASTTRALGKARERWSQAVGAWEALAVVAVGPLAERRSARQIDFAPTRPALIERAIRTAPRDAAAMERIGTPAKGLPALEWLLWKQPPAAGGAACAYARQLAQDIAREAAALRDGYAQAFAKSDDAARAALLGEALNQWLGGIEALRGRQMERPLRTTAKDGARGFPRETSGGTAASWQQQWQALRSFAVQPAGAAPQPGAGAVAFELYLRGLGLNPLADRLVARAREVDARMRALQPGTPARVQAAARALASLRTLVEREVAPALQVTLGFSDADGD